MLTKLEDQILMTVWRFKGEGYGVNVFQHLNRMNDKRVTLGVIYDVLNRMVKNGYVDAVTGEPTAIRGGMRKRYYKITPAGVDALVKSEKVHDKIMDGFSDLLNEFRMESKSS